MWRADDLRGNRFNVLIAGCTAAGSDNQCPVLQPQQPHCGGLHRTGDSGLACWHLPDTVGPSRDLYGRCVLSVLVPSGLPTGIFGFCWNSIKYDAQQCLNVMLGCSGILMTTHEACTPEFIFIMVILGLFIFIHQACVAHVVGLESIQWVSTELCRGQTVGTLEMQCCLTDNCAVMT